MSPLERDRIGRNGENHKAEHGEQDKEQYGRHRGTTPKRRRERCCQHDRQEQAGERVPLQ